MLDGCDSRTYPTTMSYSAASGRASFVEKNPHGAVDITPAGHRRARHQPAIEAKMALTRGGGSGNRTARHPEQGGRCGPGGLRGRGSVGYWTGKVGFLGGRNFSSPAAGMLTCADRRRQGEKSGWSKRWTG